MSLFVRKTETCWHLSGELVLSEVDVLLKEIPLLSSSITVDFSEVMRIDSVAVSVILEFLRQALLTNNAIGFSHLPENVLKLLNLYGVHRVFPELSIV